MSNPTLKLQITALMLKDNSLSEKVEFQRLLLTIFKTQYNEEEIEEALKELQELNNEILAASIETEPLMYAEQFYQGV